MAIDSKSKETKDRWWIFDIVEFLLGMLEIVVCIPRLVFRFLKDW